MRTDDDDSHRSSSQSPDAKHARHRNHDRPVDVLSAARDDHPGAGQLLGCLLHPGAQIGRPDRVGEDHHGDQRFLSGTAAWAMPVMLGSGGATAMEPPLPPPRPLCVSALMADDAAFDRWIYFSRMATETMGLVGGLAPNEPWKPSGEPEKSKMPPSSPTIR